MMLTTVTTQNGDFLGLGVLAEASLHDADGLLQQLLEKSVAGRKVYPQSDGNFMTVTWPMMWNMYEYVINPG